jgi:cytochrome c-type biogenesis protein CcmH/NrfG
MRCIIGIVLFVGLCFAGIRGLDKYATSRALADDPGLSQRAAKEAASQAVGKYHAYVYVAAGVITIALCLLPKLLDGQGSYSAKGTWREEAERRAAERNQRLSV